METEHIIFTHARMGNIQGVRECIEQEPSLPKTVSSISSKSLLHIAIENGHYSLTESLLKDIQLQLDEQCLYLAIHDTKDLFGYSIFKQFTRAARYEMVQLILRYDPLLLYCDPNKALVCAVEQNFTRIAKLLLEQGKADPAKLDDDGRSPLYILFEDEDPREVEDAIKITKILCKHGAMLNMQQPSLVLHQAILVKGYEQLVFYMIHKGADIYQIDEKNNGKNAVDIAVECRLDSPDLPYQLEKLWLNRNDTTDSACDNDDDDDDDQHEYEEYEDDVDTASAEFGRMDESQIENSLQNLPDEVKRTYEFIDKDLKKMSYSTKLRLYGLIMGGGQTEDYNGYDQDEDIYSIEHENLNDIDDDEEDDEEEAQRALEARLAWLKKMEEQSRTETAAEATK